MMQLSEQRCALVSTPRHEFDPKARVEFLTDLDKLRAIPDPELASYLETLFHVTVSRPLRPARGQLLLPLEASKVG